MLAWLLIRETFVGERVALSDRVIDSPHGAVTERGAAPGSEIWIRSDTLADLDFFKAEGVRWSLCSEAATDWLQQHASDWLIADEVRIE
jgi:hypothetical protein